MVPVVDLTRRHAAQTLVFLDAVERVLGSGNLLLGAELEACEHELALLLGHRHSVCVSSGASGLQLALRAVGVSTGDEVIVPAFTAVPTAAAVCALGATPVLVDVDPATAAIDAEHAADAITGRTRAIVPVHLYGRPVDLAPARGARHPDRRGCRAGPRRVALDHRGRGGLLVLPDEEPGRHRRRWRRGHR